MAYITKKTTSDGVKPIGSNLFGTCSTASATANKVVAMSDFNVLVVGVTIHVAFVNENTASNPTLSVGSTSAVAIKRNGSLEGKWESGSVISFTYDGTNWVQNDADESSGGGGNTFGTVKVGSTLLVPSQPDDVLELMEGSYVTLSANPNENTITIDVDIPYTVTPNSAGGDTVDIG